jgi:hypothetical protein
LPAGAERRRLHSVPLPCPLQVPGKYTVIVDDEKGDLETLAVRSGDVVEVVEEGAEGLW